MKKILFVLLTFISLTCFSQVISVKTSSLQQTSIVENEEKVLGEGEKLNQYIFDLNQLTATEITQSGGSSDSDIKKFTKLPDGNYLLLIEFRHNEMQIEALLDVNKKKLEFVIDVDDKSKVKMEYTLSEVEIKD